jgi:hypothetical protein
MEQRPIFIKTRLKVTERNELCHQIKLQNIHVSQLKEQGAMLKFQIKRKGQNGTILFQISIFKQLFSKMKEIKLGCARITKNGDYIDIYVERIISHKSINLIERQYNIQYIQGTELNISYSIPENLFEQKYKPKIEQMLIERNMKTASTNDNKKAPSKVLKNPNEHKSKSQIKQTIVKVDKKLRDNGNTVRNARDSSFRRCENCDYYSSRQSRCGLFSREVQPHNICTRYYYTKYRVYSGGGFSPR